MSETVYRLGVGRADFKRNLASPWKASDCSQITDGAAAAVLCPGRFAGRLARRPTNRLQGYGHTTDLLRLEAKDAPDFSVATRAAQQAYGMAGLTARELNGAEVQRCP